MKLLQKLGLLASAAVLTSPAFAVVDVSAATAAIGDGTAAVTAVGVAVLGVMGVAIVFKLVRKAM